MGRLVNKVIHHVVAAKIHQGAVPSTPPQTSHPRNGQPASWVMPSVIVPHPLRPNKRVLVELPDSSDGWTANDTKNAIEMALLAKYGRVAPGVDVPKTQQVKHGQDQAVVKAGESARNDTMDWDVAQCKITCNSRLFSCQGIEGAREHKQKRGDLKRIQKKKVLNPNP
jgi:hypothetical protein